MQYEIEACVTYIISYTMQGAKLCVMELVYNTIVYVSACSCLSHMYSDHMDH